jgi:hypothetical protein
MTDGLLSPTRPRGLARFSWTRMRRRFVRRARLEFSISSRRPAARAIVRQRIPFPSETLDCKRCRYRRFESKRWNRLKGEVRGSEIGLEISRVASRETVDDDLVGPAAIDGPRRRIEEVARPARIGEVAELVGHRQDRVSQHRPADQRPCETAVETHEGGQIEGGD